MKRTIYIACLIFLCLLVSSCGKKDMPNPNEAIDSYVADWMDNDFESMYGTLTKEAQENYSADEFIERYEKMYQDLEIKELAITPTKLTDEEKTEALDEKKATVTLAVKMDSLAGEIAFNRDVKLTLIEPEDKDKENRWEINWEEGLIFPELADGGKVTVERESPRRGEILDRNQMPLAINDIAFEVGVVPNLMENETSEVKEIARILNMTEEQITEKLNASWVQPDYFVPLKTIAKTAESQLSQLLDIPSITTKEKTGRIYPSGEATAHLTGYIGPITKEELEKQPEGAYKESDLIGKKGLEKLYEEQLHGKEGVKIIVVTEDEDSEEEQEEILAEIASKDGENIHISVDVNIQEKIFGEYDGRGGTASAINPKTGEVLALVSSPSFDPNEFIYGISQTKWDQLMDDPNEPFINRFAATFAPGSSIKPITASVGLKNGSISHDEGITINGLTWGKKSWGDVKVTRVSTTEKPVTLKDALTKSDNIYFAMKAVDMGSEKYIDGMKAFGFEEKLPIEYPISSSQISNDGKLDEILLANTSYGQGQTEVSSLHLAIAYTPFLNDGNMIKPSFLKDDKKSEVWVDNLLSKEDANKMNDYLRAVVVEGSGKSAKDKELAISGKTGTAELKLAKDSKGHENSWFVGYPTDNPDILVAMMMEKVEDVGASSYVAEKVKNVLKAVEAGEDTD